MISPENPQSDQPGRVNRNDQRIMTGIDLDRTARQQRPGIVAGKDQFAQPLQRDQSKDNGSEAHAACRSATQLAVKPGPSAVSSERGGKPFAATRSSTKSTVGADMLP